MVAPSEGTNGAGHGLDDDLDVLYAAPLENFVATRDQLARDRRTGGDRDGAAELRSVRKPSRAAWALNQAVRAAPEALDAVAAAGAQLRETQQRSLDRGDAGAVRDATRQRAQAVRALADVAVAALGPTGESARGAIEETLTAASLDPGAAVAVRAGRLTEELGPVDVFATLEPGPSTSTASPAVPAAPRPRGRTGASAPATRSPKSDASPPVPRAKPAPSAEVVQRIEQARAEATAARAELDRAEAAHAQAVAAADEAARLARDARRRATRADQEVRRAEAAATRPTSGR